MKYHVGNKVRVKPLIEFHRSKFRNPSGKMDKYCGEIATIMRINADSYRLDIDGGGWKWFDDMLEDAYDKSTISEGKDVQNQLLRNLCGIVPHSINLIGKRKYLTLKIRS